MDRGEGGDGGPGPLGCLCLAGLLLLAAYEAGRLVVMLLWPVGDRRAGAAERGMVVALVAGPVGRALAVARQRPAPLAAARDEARRAAEGLVAMTARRDRWRRRSRAQDAAIAALRARVGTLWAWAICEGVALAVAVAALVVARLGV